MDKVIVEELIRSLAFFFLFYLSTIFIGSLLFHESPISPYFVFIPLVLTLITFSFFVYERKNTGKEYHFRRGSVEYRAMMILVMIGCFFFIITGVSTVSDGTFLNGFIWISIGIISAVWSFTEIIRKAQHQKAIEIRS
jgi:Na+-transporting NADH:ubiquinone oxidoreductase subunit NqrB